MQTPRDDRPSAIPGDKLKAARATHGWSLAEVSRRTGLSRAYLNALEHGRSRRPGANVVRKLEDLFGSLTEVPPLDLAVPAGLSEAARERRIPPSEVRLLAGMRVRGQQPQSRERWAFILDAMLMSESVERGNPLPDSAQRTTE